MNWKRFNRIIITGATLVIISAAGAFLVPLPPYGRFSTPGIGNQADAYFEAANGKFTQVVFGGESGREGPVFRYFIGNYRKEQGRWILVTPSGDTSQLRATLVSLRILGNDGREAGPFYRYEIYTGR